MISALMDLLGRYYECGDFVQMEAVAKLVQHAVPDEIVSLSFLGFAYLKTGRQRKALFLFRNARQKPLAKEMQEIPIDPVGARRVLPDTHTAAAECYLEAAALNPGLAKAWQAAASEVECFVHDHSHLLAADEPDEKLKTRPG